MVALVLSLGVASAFAADPTYTITITNALANETYTAYKVFDVSYDETDGNYSYWIDYNSAFFSAVSTFAATESGMTLEQVGTSTRYNLITTAEFTDADAAALAVKLNEVSPKPTAAGTVTPTADGAATINVTTSGAGYYFVDTTLGALCALDTTDPAASITEKNPTTTVDKKVKEDSDTEQEDDLGDKNDADVGDTVYFTTTVSIKPHQKNVVLHDIMQLDKLAFNYNSIVVTGVDAANYNIYYGAHGDVTSSLPTVTVDNQTVVDPDYTGDTFAIAFDNEWTEGLTSEVTATVTYNAVLTEGAIVGPQNGVEAGQGNDNRTSVTYGNNQRSTWDWTRTYTWGFDVFKYTNGENNAKTPLAGAKFVIYNSDKTKVAKWTNAQGGIFKGWEDSAIVDGKETHGTELVTLETDKISVTGLDAGTYKLVETEAPAGYNKLLADISVLIDSNTDTAQGDDGTKQAATMSLYQDKTETSSAVNQIEVLNQSGSQLPSTGGIGTTIFYAVGGILVLAAIILLVTKKRMSE